MKTKRLTLIKVFLRKEKLFWKRINSLVQTKANILSKILAILLVSICRYGGTIMHLFFECSLYLFDREQFRKNMKVLNYKTEIVFRNLDCA